jgi:cell division protease FtsH
MIDTEVQRIIAESYADACRLLSAHRKALDALVEALLQRETLDEAEILEVTGLPAAPALAARSARSAGADANGDRTRSAAVATTRGKR